tara:strand:- start:4601 stop:6979 length:2379 start_codon:yes stop_codon:yes gene_type:complete
MGLLSKKKSKKEQMAEVRRKRHSSQTHPPFRLFRTSVVISTLIFLLFTGLIILICFVGQAPSGPQVLFNQIAKTRIVADFPFSYESKALTEDRRTSERQRIAPVYTLSLTPYESFRDKILVLQDGLDELQIKLSTLPQDEAPDLVETFRRALSQSENLHTNTEDLLDLVLYTQREERARMFSEGLIILREIFREGIFDPNQSTFPVNPEQPYFFSIEIDGYQNEVRAQSEEEALRFLRINLSALEIDPQKAKILYRILRAGVAPNLTYDAIKSEEKILKMLDTLGPITVHVAKDQTIIEPNTLVTAEKYEQFLVYRKKLREAQDLGLGLTNSLIQRSLFAFMILIGAFLYLQLSMPHLGKNKQHLLLMATIMVFNLILIRLLLELADTSLLSTNAHFLAILPYTAPIAIGTILTTIMMGVAPAILMAILITTLNVLMQGMGFDFLFAGTLSCLIGVYYSQNIRQRLKVVRASLFGGIVMALFALVIGLLSDVHIATISRQMGLALFSGALTGVIIIGVLPLLENLFKYTTDITLLELTDFNHPLLRRLQMVAPGTYHHSLMVANLAERAAAEIGANPLICRVCALFHDIGKMVKPEYFTENQQDNFNPHQEKSPSMSALVIKSHVKEGSEMAKEAKLPQIIIDVIEQHHGTTLIQFFYDKALKQNQSQAKLPFHKTDQVSYEGDEVDESIFRYDGPRPRFKESAIVLFADSIEAASRSLKKVSAQSVQELIDQIFQERLEDHQLDECPITMQEMRKIKKSFNITILNMLHSRVEYPKKEAARKNKEEKKEEE